MPRLPAQLILKGRRFHPSVPLLLGTCRDLASARNEFRWLRDHALNVALNGLRASIRLRNNYGIPQTPRQEAYERRLCLLAYRTFLKSLCVERGRGRPLQYLLGSQYFGELEIMCKPGVLIPRPETADMVTALVERLAQVPMENKSTIRILDLCTGTGCISLLLHNLLIAKAAQLHSELKFEFLGVDVSAKAVSLARMNLRHLIPPLSQSNISFALADVLSLFGNSIVPALQDLLQARAQTSWDILVSNPPYISPPKYLSSLTARSVRNYEPRLALVPPQTISGQFKLEDSGDHFYPFLFAHAARVDAKVVLFEVGDYEQALRVAKMAVDDEKWTGGVEIWKDNLHSTSTCPSIALGTGVATVKGNGAGRAVVCWKKGWLSP